MENKKSKQNLNFNLISTKFLFMENQRQILVRAVIDAHTNIIAAQRARAEAERNLINFDNREI
jgi:hypothetical protein